MIQFFLGIVALLCVSALFLVSYSGIKFYTLHAEVDDTEKDKDSIKLKLLCIIIFAISVFSIVTLLFI
jgi:hypothetical protein